MMENWPESWQKKWQEQGFTDPAPIQEKVYGPLQAGESLVGIAPTGSGKTLAYLLPLLAKITKGEGNQLMILTSSQELAIQVTDVTRAWAQLLGLKVQQLIGGASVKRQIEKLKEKPEILVATPGRALELMKQKKLKAHLLKTIVLDEVDQLLPDRGAELISDLLKHLPRDIQLACFSATADKVLDQLQALRPDIQVLDVTAEDNTQGTISHRYLIYPQRRKVDALRRLGHLPGFQGLVFFNQLAEMGVAEEKLLYHNLPVLSLASDQSKSLRKTALTSFREGKIVELLTTDVAARGLDITGLKYVINTEVPTTPESYLHRAGRVGRMGADGIVVTIIGEHQLKELKQITRKAGVTVSEIFLFDGQLWDELPEQEENTTVFSKKLEIHQKIQTSPKEKKVSKKPKKKKNKNKDKGKRKPKANRGPSA